MEFFLKKFLYTITLFTALLFIFSCNELPTDVGYTFLYDTVSVKGLNSSDTTLISGLNLIFDKRNVFNTGTLFIGNSNSMKAFSMLRFAYIPDSLEYLTENDIQECYMTLQPTRYAYGDSSNGILSFKLFKISKFWSVFANSDTILDQGQSSSYFDNTLQGSFSGHIKLADTMETIRINLTKQLIVDWFKLENAYKTDSTKINWGIALVPDDNNTVINTLSAQAINTSDSRPYITVVYKNKLNDLDTAKFSTAIDVSFISRPAPDKNLFAIQGSTSIKSKFTFDLSMIPKDVAIHAAELDLNFDKTLSRLGNFPLDTFIAGGVFKDGILDSGTTNTFTGILNNGNNKFYFRDLSAQVERWVKYSSGKPGELVIYPNSWTNVRRLDEVVFYDSSAPDSLKPKLKIIYSTRIKKKD